MRKLKRAMRKSKKGNAPSPTPSPSPVEGEERVSVLKKDFIVEKSFSKHKKESAKKTLQEKIADDQKEFEEKFKN